MDSENDNLPSVSLSAYCCIHLQSLLACVNKPKALAIIRDHHTALLLFMPMEWFDVWRGIKGIMQMGKNVTALDKGGIHQWAFILWSQYTPYSTVQYFLRPDRQSVTSSRNSPHFTELNGEIFMFTSCFYWMIS
jgi:hypothetical protein